jgi:hypothetical protein
MKQDQDRNDDIITKILQEYPTSKMKNASLGANIPSDHISNV